MHMDEVNAQWRKDAVRYTSPFHSHLQLVVHMYNRRPKGFCDTCKGFKGFVEQPLQCAPCAGFSNSLLLLYIKDVNQKQASSQVTIRMSLKCLVTSSWPCVWWKRMDAFVQLAILYALADVSYRAGGQQEQRVCFFSSFPHTVLDRCTSSWWGFRVSEVSLFRVMRIMSGSEPWYNPAKRPTLKTFEHASDWCSYEMTQGINGAANHWHHDWAF